MLWFYLKNLLKGQFTSMKDQNKISYKIEFFYFIPE